MQRAKPQWQLLIHILPPLFFSLALVLFFPASLWQCWLALTVLIALLSVGWMLHSTWLSWQQRKKSVLIKPGNGNHADVPTQTSYQGKGWHEIMDFLSRLLSLFGLLALVGISAIFLMFLTAASQLAPQDLAFGDIIKLWHISFPLGMVLLFAQIISRRKKTTETQKNISLPKQSNAVKTLSSLLADHREKNRQTSQIFLYLSELCALIIPFAIVIFTLTNGFARWFGFSVQTGVQLQAILGSTLIYLPFMSQRFHKQRRLKKVRNRVIRLLYLSVGFIGFLFAFSTLTQPLANFAPTTPLLPQGLAPLQWQLFIVAWWLGITSLLATQIATRWQNKPLWQIVFMLALVSSLVDTLGNTFLTTIGQDYFSAVINQGILALWLTALPIGGLLLSLSRFQQPANRKLIGSNKLQRTQNHITHALIQLTAMSCVLYWVTGLSLLFVLFLMASTPRLWLLVEMRT